MRVRVKICGVRCPQDVWAAADAGADAIGLNFVPGTPRHLPAERARALAGETPPLVARVGVWLNPSLEELEETLARVPLDLIQLHGDEPPEFCASLAPRSVLKALQVRAAADIDRIGDYQRVVRGIVLDAGLPGQAGGTGRTFPWEWACRARERFPRVPLILAGGLTPDNVAEAIERVRPYGVDVSSGVERVRGVKDPDLIARFLNAVRTVGD